MKNNKFKNITLMTILMIGISQGLFAQSGTFGNTYIFDVPPGEMAIHDVQQNFINGGNGVQAGIVGTDRTGNKGFLSFVGMASHTGASNTAHVDGYAKTYMTTAFTFPIGDNGVYRPAAVSTAAFGAPADAAYYGISGTTAITTSLKGGNEPVLPTGGPFATTSKDAALTAVDNAEYWDINGTTAAKITLTYNTNSGVNALTGGTLNKLTIVGWDGTKWVAIPSTLDTTSLLGSTSNLSTGSITTNAAILPNTYNVYTLGASTICTAGTDAPSFTKN